MVRNVARCVGSLLVVLLASPASGAEAPPPDEFVRAEIGALSDLLTGGAPDRLEVLRRRVRALADFDGFARKSLGKTWGSLSPGERKRFRDSLQGLLESYYMGRPGSIFDERKASVQGAKVTGEEAEVALTVAREDADVAVVVRLRRAGAGWIAEDVTIDGLSLLEDYRAQFRSFLAKHSIRELIERLGARAKAQRERRDPP